MKITFKKWEVKESLWTIVIFTFLLCPVIPLQKLKVLYQSNWDLMHLPFYSLLLLCVLFGFLLGLPALTERWDKSRIQYKNQGKRQAGKYNIIPFKDMTTGNIPLETGLSVPNDVPKVSLEMSTLNKLNETNISPPAPHDARDEQNTFQKFEQELGRPLSPMEAERIMNWEKEYASELVIESLKRAVAQGKTNMRYVESILSNWKKNNIRTLLEVKRQDKEFEERKQKGGTTRGSTNQSNGKPGDNYQPVRGSDAGKEIFPGYDRSKFEFPG